VGARSTTTARALLAQHAGLGFIVQMTDRDGPNMVQQVDPRISVQYRARGESQFVKTAQVFVLYLPGASLHSSRDDVLAEMAGEMKVHFELLRVHSYAKLLLVAELLPGPDKAESKVEAAARSHDLFLMQLSNGGLLEMAELQELVSSVGDDTGRLVVVNQVCSRQGATVLLQVRIEER
jgi:hypothetical protein